MLRRLAVLVSAALLALGAPGLSTAPAQARATAVVEDVFSPLTLGGYCAAQVNPTSDIGFYNGWLNCYDMAASGLVFTGAGNPGQACVYYHPTWSLIGYSQGVGQALLCRYSV
ncbi:hypothetical protein ACIBEJ_08070 [Nonomuraea sp. NPDC050790]|uniref:hypothetical protein n=1 Tax=Nonomuraea sp. NPDC050790 TaxID=3364371 RepID=UPI003794F38D